MYKHYNIPLNADYLSKGYRNAVRSDIAKIVNVHKSAFPGFFMTILGDRFLHKYYSFVLSFPGSIFWVKEELGEIQGFVSGFLNPSLFYKSMKKHRIQFLITILLRILVCPWLIARLLASYSQAGRSARGYAIGDCELSSIGVHPEHSKQGIGRELLKRFIDSAMDKAESIVLTTDTDCNNAVNGFYIKHGFSRTKCYERSPGRWVNEYRLNFHNQ